MKNAWKLSHAEVCRAIASYVIEENEVQEGGFFRVQIVLPQNGSPCEVNAIVSYEGNDYGTLDARIGKGRHE